MRALVAFDKLRGTLTANDACAAASSALTDHEVTVQPLADGGEGLLEVFGGPNRVIQVTGPLGTPVAARWRSDDDLAIIESAQACGLEIAGGPENNSPLDATTFGVGELIREAIHRGHHTILIGIGGSATTDCGQAAIEARCARRLRGLHVTVACDVTTRFVDAATEFAPQKGASAAQVKLLTARLRALESTYEREYGAAVGDLEGGGAGGGLAGGLAALGAQLASGFEVIAETISLDNLLDGVELVITGEGRLDHTSFAGKVVGSLATRCQERSIPLLIIAGQVAPELNVPWGTVVDLTATFGAEQSLHDTTLCIQQAIHNRNY